MSRRDVARFALRIARHGLSTTMRRPIYGPGRPNWTIAFETAVRALQQERDEWEERSARLGYDFVGFRNSVASITPPSLAIRSFTIKQLSHGTEIVGSRPTERLIVYLHGGGYTGGSFATHADLVARIALAADSRALVPDYRVAPEHRFPAALDDCVAAVRAAYATTDPRHVVIAGDSAGGGLVFAVALALRAAGEPLPAGLVGLSPWVDLLATAPSIGPNRPTDYCSEPTMHAQREAYAPGVDPKNPLVSPLYGDLSGLPPMLVQVGGGEMLRDDGARLVERAREAGVQAELDEYPHMPHVFQVFADIAPPAAQAIDAVGRFVRRVSGSSGPLRS